MSNYDDPQAKASDPPIIIQGAASDPPIIIQGGGSISMNVPPKFKEKGSTANGKDFKDDTGNLVSIQINEDTPIKLNKDDKITINYLTEG